MICVMQNHNYANYEMIHEKQNKLWVDEAIHLFSAKYNSNKESQDMKIQQQCFLIICYLL